MLLHDLVEEIGVYLLTLLIGDPILCSRIEFLHLRVEAFLLNALHLHLVRQMIELVLIEFLLFLHLSLESLLLLEYLIRRIRLGWLAIHLLLEPFYFKQKRLFVGS